MICEPFHVSLRRIKNEIAVGTRTSTTVMANAHTSVANVTRGTDSPSSLGQAAICSGAFLRQSLVVTGLSSSSSKVASSSRAIHRTVPAAVVGVYEDVCRIRDRPKSVSLALPASSTRISLCNWRKTKMKDSTERLTPFTSPCTMDRLCKCDKAEATCAS